MATGRGQGPDSVGRGHCVSTVGLNESVIRRCIRNQEDGSRIE